MPRVEDAHVAVLRSKLDASLERNRLLERENEQLKQEVLNLNAQIASLRAQSAERKSALWKKLQTSITSNISAEEKQIIQDNAVEESFLVNKSRCMQGFSDLSAKTRSPRVPKPPPKPSACLNMMPKSNGKKEAHPPPPPPLPPPKLQGMRTNMVRRAPEVVELYRTLTRRDLKNIRTPSSGVATVTNSREMIGEIENKSAYLLAIKSDVETQVEFIRILTREVENAAYSDIDDVEAFVKWLDEELSYLVDERAVLKHFPKWPERKADAMREAAFGYRDLRILELEVSSFYDDPCQPLSTTLKRMQTLQDKLERSVHNLEKVRDSASRKYKEFQIPSEWMLDSGIIAKLKAGSMKLAKEYIKRIVITLQSQETLEAEELMLQGVRFAFRIHQFAGGLDAESRHEFQELKKVASSYHW